METETSPREESPHREDQGQGNMEASTGDVSMQDGRLDPRSPMSAGGLNTSTMSMRAKVKRKRQANAQHNSNFRAGYVPIDEDVLHRSGIRGRKRYFLYCTLVFLLIVALLNALVTAWLVYLLGITHYGMMSIELTSVHGRDFLRVLSDANIITMSFSDQGFLGARHDSNLSFLSEKKMKVSTKKSSVLLEEGNITMTADDISVVSSEGKRTPISIEAVTGMAANLHVAHTTVSRVESLSNFRQLSVESVVNEITMTGMDDVNFSSQKDIKMETNAAFLRAQSEISMDGQQGIYVNPNLLNISISTFQHGPSNAQTYKLCVCDTGQLFKVPYIGRRTTCDVGSSLYSLCAF